VVSSSSGWITGRGDDTMVMLDGYHHIRHFFASLAWWELKPNNDFFEAQGGGNSATGDATIPTVLGMRSDNGELAVLYLPAGGSVKIKPGVLEKGLWSIWYNPRSNVRQFTQPDAQARFVTPDKEDWVLQLGFGPTGSRAPSSTVN